MSSSFNKILGTDPFMTRTHQKTLRWDFFTVTKAVFPFSETLRDFSEHKHRFRHEGADQ
jgi:hypothetical protein